MMQASYSKPAVLFVCLGNICRSPMAEGAFRELARRAGLDCSVDSVGTAGYHIGEPPDPRAIATARANGVDISGLAGRQLCAQDFDQFSHIFALDKANMEGIKARAPRKAPAHIAMLLDGLDGYRGQAVPDPYYGDDAGFVECWQVITAATSALVAEFARSGVEARFR